MHNKYTDKAAEALEKASKMAATLGHSYIGSEHLLIGLIQTDGCVASVLLGNANVTDEDVINLVYQLIAPDNSVAIKEKPGKTPKLKKILGNAEAEAARLNSEMIGTEHMLIVMLREKECVATRLLNTMNVNIRRLYEDIFRAIGENPDNYREESKNGRKNKKQFLEQYSTDMTELARNNSLDPVVGREKEIQRVIQILSRRTKNNPCLIGEPGVGKTAIVEGLAARIVSRDVPETIADMRVLTLDLSSMVAGSKYRGEFEERIKRVLAEVKEEGNILLFLDEIHTLIGAGGAEGAIDAANILKPSLARGEIQIIGATTIEEYRKYLEKDAALERRFQPVKVEEPSEEEAIDILMGLKGKYEEFHKLTITDEAIKAAVRLSKRYINDRNLPDKAIDIIDEAASKAVLSVYVKPDELKELENEIKELECNKEQNIINEEYDEAARQKKLLDRKNAKLQKMLAQWEQSIADNSAVVDEESVAEVISLWTKIPVAKIAQAETDKLINLEKMLHERVVGQEEAVVALAKAIRRGRVGLKDPDRPIGSFLFLGPTGVGKTELSKALAQVMFGSQEALIRVDMSEYMEKHTVSKMIGSPPGYVGYNEGGQFSEKVRRNPYSVILFDEIEKAHPDVFNVLLQVLDDGRITDSTGRVIDFKNTIIIMTSNAGAENIIQPKLLGFATETDEKKNHEIMKNKVMDEVKRLFKPEFINRIDEITVFHTLNKDEIGQIVDLLMNAVNKRMLAQMKISLELDAAAKEYIVNKGYDEKYGARPLRRTIQNEIEDALADSILEGRIKNGNRVLVTMKNDKIHFRLKRGKNN